MNQLFYKYFLSFIFFIVGISLNGQSSDIVWKTVIGCNVSGNSLTKTAGRGWNAGAISTQILSQNNGGWIEMDVNETNTHAVYGLSSINTSVSYQSIDYGVYLRNGNIQIFESGAFKGSFGTYSQGDKFRVERTSDMIAYKKNGTTFYTSLVSSSSELIADASIFSSGATITNATFCFGSKCFSSSSSVFVDDDNSGDGTVRYSEGKVIIGDALTNKQGDYRLYVQGGILTELAKVSVRNSASWADYVFEENYQLNTIEEVEAFVKQNKHLPNIPSATEVTKEGIDVAKMDASLLRQIEELWLHLIKLSKENKELEDKIDLLLKNEE